MDRRLDVCAAALLLAALALLVVAPRGANAQASALSDAIVRANAAGGTGAPIRVVLTSNIALSTPLPELSGTARLTVVGNCKNAQGAKARCAISGGDSLAIFSSPATGPTTGALRLSSLLFTGARGGVFARVRAAINASDCVFMRNTAGGMGGGVLSDIFPASSTPPTRTFTDCTFQDNTAPLLGGAVVNINAGNPLGRTPALSFTRCLFKTNAAARSLGGAISVAGSGGRLKLSACAFDSNSAGASGGGIFAYGTTVVASKTAFRGNRAEGTAPGGSFVAGVGAAVHVVSGLVGKNAASFCACSFANNVGSGSAASSSTGAAAAGVAGGVVYLQKAPGNSAVGGGTVTFCSMARPAGLFVSKTGWTTGKMCTPSTCK